MLHITILEQKQYLLVVAIAQEELQPIDLLKVRLRKITLPFAESVPETLAAAVMGPKGIVVVDTTTPSYVIGFITSESRNRVPWMGAHFKGQVGVYNSTSPDRVVGEAFNMRLPCLKCLEEGKNNPLRADAVYPYCKQHQDSSPHRFKKSTPT